MLSVNFLRRLTAEAVGTMLLVAVVIGSGIMGERLAAGNDAVALLGNTLATGAVLPVLIIVLGPLSGAHFNPIVSASFALQRALPWNECAAYVAVQIAGGIAGTLLAHLMFGLQLIQAATHARTGLGVWTGEIVASFALLLTIMGCLRSESKALPYAVGLIITAGYWFTSSTSFANPAIAIARSMTDTFSGIRPQDVPGFIIAECFGALLASALFRWLFPFGAVSRRAPTESRSVSSAPRSTL